LEFAYLSFISKPSFCYLWVRMRLVFRCALQQIWKWDAHECATGVLLAQILLCIPMKMLHNPQSNLY
jgi:hypothetical protein